MERHTMISGLDDLILKTCQSSSKFIYNFTVMPIKVPTGLYPQLRKINSKTYIKKEDP